MADTFKDLLHNSSEKQKIAEKNAQELLANENERKRILGENIKKITNKVIKPVMSKLETECKNSGESFERDTATNFGLFRMDYEVIISKIAIKISFTHDTENLLCSLTPSNKNFKKKDLKYTINDLAQGEEQKHIDKIEKDISNSIETILINKQS